MLIGTLPGSPEKRLSLFIRSEPFRMVLAGLLEQWRYPLQENPADADLFLAEDGFPVPEDGTPVLWLSRSRHEDKRNRLFLPLSVEELWAELETRFHGALRSRMRIRLELPATLEARNETDEVLIFSLSELGGRFDWNRELAPGEELVLSLSIARRRLKLPARVIYVAPRDMEGSGKAQIGVMFDYRDLSERKILNDFILQSYLGRARGGMDGTLFSEGLTHFDVQPAVLRKLGFPSTHFRSSRQEGSV